MPKNEERWSNDLALAFCAIRLSTRSEWDESLRASPVALIGTVYLIV
jgi:hypothetical protein